MTGVHPMDVGAGSSDPGFAQEPRDVVRAAVDSGAFARDPVLRHRLGRQWAELRTLRWNALRTLGSPPAQDCGAPNVAKRLWARRRLGGLAVDARGAAATAGPGPRAPDAYELHDHERLFLFGRADTVQGGSDEIRRPVVAERVLGLPKEPRP
ncbi:hypothetical protein HW130_16870 [Streptomyces sp. PKU-EA00015]|nr:hypothetical protein [Streptomyces sp. PKU-EA00015]